MSTIHEEIQARLQMSRNFDQLRENYEWLAEEYDDLNRGAMEMEHEVERRYGKKVLYDIADTVGKKIAAEKMAELNADMNAESDFNPDDLLNSLYGEER